MHQRSIREVARRDRRDQVAERCAEVLIHRQERVRRVDEGHRLRARGDRAECGRAQFERRRGRERRGATPRGAGVSGIMDIGRDRRGATGGGG